MKLKDVINTFGEAMEMNYGNKILTGHKKAMSAIQRCRAEGSGTVHVKCPECGDTEIFYHSCGIETVLPVSIMKRSDGLTGKWINSCLWIITW